MSMTTGEWIDRVAREAGVRRSQVIRQIAADLGVSPGYLAAIAGGRLRPSPRLALRIERASGGMVSAVDLVFGRTAKEAGR